MDKVRLGGMVQQLSDFFFHVRNSMRILANGPLTVAFVGASKGGKSSESASPEILVLIFVEGVLAGGQDCSCQVPRYTWLGGIRRR